jgi:YD repeat-containing protein
VRDFGYDYADRRTSETWTTGGATVQTQTFDYDLLDRMTSATDPDGTTTMTYDALGQTVGVSGPWGVDLTFGYDQAGNRTSVTDNKGGSTVSTFDALNRLSTRTQTASGMGTVRADWTYTKAGDVASVTRYSDTAGTQKAGGTGNTYDNARRRALSASTTRMRAG